jgi:hypothetical protein
MVNIEGKNAFNPYNSVTKYFLFICFENLPLVIPSAHTYIPLMCVGHEKQNELTLFKLFSYIDTK